MDGFTIRKRKIQTITLLVVSAIILSACSFFSDGGTSGDISHTSRSSELSEPKTEVSGSADNVSLEDEKSTVSESANSITSEAEESTVSETSSRPPVSEYSQPEVSYDDDDVYISNGIIVVGTRAMEQYGGGVKNAAAYAGYINDFKAALGDGVNVYSMPIPIASAFYAPAEYNASVNNHIKTFDSLRNNLTPDVKDVNLLTALAPHTEEPLYARTDFHWNALGAYYAAQEFANVAGLPFTDLSGFTQDSFSGYVGSLRKNVPALSNYPEEFIWYVPNQQYTVKYYDRATFSRVAKDNNSLFFSGNSYSKFIGGDSYCVRIDTSIGNGRKLLYFKESYGNALAPFLISSFEQINIVDIRYFDFNIRDFIEQNGITDVCFSLSAFSIVGGSGKRVQYMDN